MNWSFWIDNFNFLTPLRDPWTYDFSGFVSGWKLRSCAATFLGSEGLLNKCLGMLVKRCAQVLVNKAVGIVGRGGKWGLNLLELF